MVLEPNAREARPRDGRQRRAGAGNRAAPGGAGHHVWCRPTAAIEAAEGLSRAFVRLGGSAEAVQFDVVDSVATDEALAGLLADGPIQILVNNAGIHDDAVMPGMTRDSGRVCSMFR